MKLKKHAFIIKLILIHLLFILLHYLYDWFPNRYTAVVSGTNESIYQHMKIGFFAYLFLILGEVIFTRRSAQLPAGWFFARLFACTFFPLAILLIYLVGPLAWGKVESVAFEVVFANLALLASSFTALVVEGQVEKAKPSPMFRVVVAVLFIISLLEYVAFTNQVPWFDIFAIPPGY